MYRHLLILSLILLVPLSHHAWAQAAGDEEESETVDCKKFRDIPYKESTLENREDLRKCITGAWPPPTEWRPDKGRGRAKVPGSNFVISTIQAPDQPPYVRGAKPSVSNKKIGFSMSFPPWPGFPCQLPGGTNICDDDDDGDGGGDDGDGDDPISACPVRDDATGIFGQKLPITGSSSFTLDCGAALPLSTYQMTLSQNPVGMVATEYESPYLWVYKPEPDGAGKTVYKSVTTDPIKLPTHLCLNKGGDMEKSITFRGPIPQMVLYNASTTTLAIRMVQDVSRDPMNPDPEVPPEKYLVVPIQNGVPNPPNNCANENIYYKTLTGIAGDVVFETSVAASCQAPANFCNRMKLNTPPATPTSCASVVTYPQGGTPEAQCGTMSQMIAVDRPNLVYPPGSTPSFSAIDGRTAVVASTVPNSVIYTSSTFVIRLNRTGQSFTLPEGGFLLLENSNQLAMVGPVTINTGTGAVTLTNGGYLIDNGGLELEEYPNGTVVTPTVVWPMTIRLNRDIEMPAGYYVPTQPSPYLHAPVQSEE